MRIRSKLLLIAVMPLLLLLASWQVHTTLNRAVESAHRQLVEMQELAQHFSELAVLTLEHHIFYHDRAHEQWLLKHHQLALELASLAANRNLGGGEALQAVQKSHENMGKIFVQYGEHVRDRRNRDEIFAWQQRAEPLTSRILQDLQSVNSNLDQLLEGHHARVLGSERALNRLELWLIVLETIIVVAIALLIYRAFSRPLRLLNEGVARFAAGDLAYRISLPPKDELGELAVAVDRMAGRLQGAEEQLLLANEELEQRVKERTEELSTANRGLLAEIEQRRLTEAALRDSEARHRVLFDHAGDGIMIFDLEGHILALNRIFCERLGYLPEELLGKTPAVIDPPKHAAVVGDRFRMIREQGHALFEVEHVRKDGTVMPVEVNCQVVDYAGQPAIISIVRDITERKLAEAELLRLKDAAEEASRAKSEFIANVSHELRTPMNAIIGLTHLALEREPTAAPRGYLEKVQHSAETLLAIINDILDFSKIEAGKLQLEESEFHLNEVVDVLVDMFGERAAEKGLELLCRVDPRLPDCLVGDRLRLSQVLINLVNNAIKFTENGEVELQFAPCGTPLGEELILLCSVRDTGIGIGEEQVEQLFQPFTQGDSSMTRRYGGTGLGLCISKRLVEAMGGSLTVTSQPGKGSTFCFSVPLRQGVCDDQPPLQTAEEGRAALRGARILVAEDHGINQLFIREVLEQSGATVVLAANGSEAVAAMLQTPLTFDLVLMDIQMPEMDGYEATRRIRQLPGGKDLPIIAMTAHAMREERERCLQAGMDAHLAKPVRVRDLYLTLASYLRRQPPPVTEAAQPSPAAASQVLPVPDHLPGIDVTAGLEQMDGSVELFRRIVHGFAEEKRDAPERIRQALAAGERHEAERLAHGIKGIAGSIGAGELRVVAFQLEEAIEKGNDAAIPQLLVEFAARLREVLEADDILEHPERQG